MDSNESFPGQCPGVNAFGERCASTVHEGPHTWEAKPEPEMLAIIRERDRALAAVGVAEPHAGPARLLHYVRMAPGGENLQAAEVTVDEAGLVTVTAEVLALLLVELGFHLEAEDVLA